MQSEIECPECQTQFHVKLELIGENVRCPVCRHVFTARLPGQEMVPPPRTEAAPPMVVADGDFDLAPMPIPQEVVYVPEAIDEHPSIVIRDSLPDEVEKRSPRRSKKPSPPPAPPSAPPKVVVFDDDEPAQVVGPREYIWTEDGGMPVESAPAASPRPAPTAGEGPEERPLYSWEKEKPRSRRPVRLLMIVLGVAFIGIAGTWGGNRAYNYFLAGPERLISRAQAEYKELHYDAARKLFDQFATEFPAHPRHAEARFYAELSQLRMLAYSAVNRSNPIPAIEQLAAFQQAIEDPELAPFAAPDQAAYDIWESVRKLIDDTVTHAQDVFKLSDPEESSQWADRVDPLFPVLERFRTTDSTPDDLMNRLKEIRDKVARARERLRILDQVRQLLVDPTDAKLDAAERILLETKLLDDAEAQQLLKDAEAQLLKRVQYRKFDPPQAPLASPPIPYASLLIVPKLTTAAKSTSAPSESSSPRNGIFFASARGVVMAMDEADGKILWATRVGIDCDIPPLSIAATNQSPEMVIVAVNEGKRSSLTARNPRTGAAIWHQPLPAPILGKPLAVDQRLYVPLRDIPNEDGSPLRRDQSGQILEFESVQGYLLGKFSLGRALGGPGVHRAGSGLIYFPAESRTVYTFDVKRRTPDGQPLDPEFVGLIQTDHPAGTLQGSPLLVDTIPGDTSAASYLLLLQTDGLSEVRLRALPLQSSLSAKPMELNIAGWVGFAPVSNPEVVALVTDQGELRLFGINQLGNDDKLLFDMIPPANRPGDGASATGVPSRGLVAYFEEGTLWVVMGGKVVRFRQGLSADRGMVLLPQEEEGFPVGDPLQPAQVSPSGTMMIVSQKPELPAPIATAVDRHTGKMLWQRQLGLNFTQQPLVIGDQVWLVDRSGGIYAIDVPSLSSGRKSTAWLTGEEWLRVAPYPTTNPQARQLFDAKESRLVVLLPTTREQKDRLLIRQVVPGQEPTTREVLLPFAMAGEPILSAGNLYLPLEDGAIYRLPLEPGSNLQQGPTWRGERVNLDSRCALAAINADEFLATDGYRGIARWRWESGQSRFELRGRLRWNERINLDLQVFSVNGEQRLLFVDQTGVCLEWSLGQFDRPIRSWNSEGNPDVPRGTLSQSPWVYAAGGDGEQTRLALAIGDKVHWLDPNQNKPLWTVPLDGGTLIGKPQRLGDSLYLTTTTGRFLQVEVATGNLVRQIELGNAFTPSSPWMPLNAEIALAPLADGTIILIPLTQMK